MVPNGWNKQTVGDLCDFINGNGFKSSEWSDKGLPIIRIQNLNGSNNFNYYEGAVLEKWIVNQGDILFAWAGSKGVSFGAKYWDGPKGLLNQHIFRVEPKAHVDKKWLFWVLLKVTQRVENMAHGFKATLLHVQKADITEQVILVPSLAEQQRIAQILSTWDQAISATEKLLKNSQQQKKALMQQLLTGKKRLLDENGVKFSDSWKTNKLGQLFKERVEMGRDDLPLLSITADDGVVYQEETGRKNTSNEDKSKYRRICVNDIGYNTMRMWQGRSSLSDKDGIVSPAYTIIIPSEKIVPRFAAYLFKLPKLVHVFYRHSQGLVSDTWNLKFSHFKEISWSFPCVKEQQKIAEVLFTADQEIETLQKKLDCLKQEKKALMQQLLTGKKRVKVAA